MISSHPQRLRSNSFPSRPRASTTDPEPAPVHPPAVSPPATPSAPSDSRPNSPKHKPNPLSVISAWSHAGSRKILRPRRPGSSGSPLHSSHSPDSAFRRGHAPSSSVPPRPPRNPARIKSCDYSSSHSQDFQPPAMPPLPRRSNSSAARQVTTPVQEDEALRYPFSTGQEFILQRKKSRNSRLRPPSESGQSKEIPFSTVDRTILEELRAKILARESQFILRNGKKYHSLPVQQVPYPTSYEKRVLDHDVWETNWAQQIAGSVTWHMFESAPAKILDIGCGTGMWILNSARTWKESHFVGLDIVPLHPDLQQLGSECASRITWIQANFLESLPFPSEEFDYVHMKRIARGVPEDKWDSFFEEILRVMKPGAAIELIEEDLYFPGQTHSLATPPSTVSRASLSFKSSSSRTLSLSNESDLPATAHTTGHTTRRSFEDVIAPSSVPWSSSPTLPTPVSVYHLNADRGASGGSSTNLSEASTYGNPVNPRDHSILEHIYNEMHAERFINLEPIPLIANLMSMYFKDARAHPPLLFKFPPPAADEACATDETSTLVDTDDTYTAHDNDRPDGKPRRPLSDAQTLRPTPRRPITKGILHREDLVVDHAEPDLRYVSYDASRLNAFSPTPSRDLEKVNKRLPNQTLDVDINSLNLHLALRVYEILSCSEAMWDYVVAYQRRNSRKRLFDPLGRSAVDPLDSALMDLSRRDFDVLLSCFELDMHDSISFGTLLTHRLGWNPVPASQAPARVEFNKRCAAWAKHVASLEPVPSADGDSRQSTHSQEETNSTGIDVTDGEPAQTSDVGAPDRASKSPSQPPAPLPPPAPPVARLNRTMRVYVAWKE